MSALCPRVTLTQNGPEFSRIVAGMWRMQSWPGGAQAHLRFIEECLEVGVSTFDHADIYGDYQVEALFGAALAQRPMLRDGMQLVSKCGIRLPSAQRPGYRIKSYDSSALHIIASVEQSLRNLQTDYLDLLLIHRPDPLLDVAEVAQAFQQLQQAGKVRHLGVSNFSPLQFDALQRHFPLVTNQIELSPLQPQALQDGSLDHLQGLGIKPMLWSALGGGRLFTGGAPAGLLECIQQLAAEYQLSPAALVYAWLLRLPSQPLPLTGSGRIGAVRDAVAACHVTLRREDWFALWQAARGREVD